MKKYVRNMLDDNENCYSEPEDGDNEFTSELLKTDKELLMMHRGNFPKEKKDPEEKKKKQ